jgi:predicted transcriptional regulator
MADQTIGVRLDDQTRERYRRLGERKRRSSHYLMKEALARYLEEEEALEARLAAYEEESLDFSATGEAIPSAQIDAWILAMLETGNVLPFEEWIKTKGQIA